LSKSILKIITIFGYGWIFFLVFAGIGQEREKMNWTITDVYSWGAILSSLAIIIFYFYYLKGR